MDIIWTIWILLSHILFESKNNVPQSLGKKKGKDTKFIILLRQSSNKTEMNPYKKKKQEWTVWTKQSWMKY